MSTSSIRSCPRLTAKPRQVFGASMDASRIARAFLCGDLGCCHPSGLWVRRVAAGLDEIRGPAPDHGGELEARAPNWVLPTSVLTDLPSRRDCPRSSWTFLGLLVRSGRGAIGLAGAQHRPEDPRQLVGDRRDHDVE